MRGEGGDEERKEKKEVHPTKPISLLLTCWCWRSRKGASPTFLFYFSSPTRLFRQSRYSQADQDRAQIKFQVRLLFPLATYAPATSTNWSIVTPRGLHAQPQAIIPANSGRNLTVLALEALTVNARTGSLPSGQFLIGCGLSR